MTIGDTCFLEVLPAPDAGRQGKAMTQLAVRTKTTVDSTGAPLVMDTSGSNTKFESVIEFLTLPPIPVHKWVMITISREGRRFDIYYDGNLVLSQKTLYNIATTADTKGVIVGGAGFGGYGAGFDFAPTATNGSEVSAKHSQRSDTRGAPFVTLPEDVSTTSLQPVTGAAMSLPGFTIGGMKLPSICPTGGCFTGPTVRPAQPWLDWETSYA